MRHLLRVNVTETAHMDGEENSSLPPRESRGNVLLQRSLPPFVSATVDQGEWKASSSIQVPPLPTFALR